MRGTRIESNSTLPKKVWIWLGSFLLVVLVLAYMVAQDSCAKLQNVLAELTLNRLALVEFMLDKEALLKVAESGDDTSPEYIRLNEYLNAMRVLGEFKFLCTFVVRDGKIVYLVDGMPPHSELFSPLGTEDVLVPSLAAVLEKIEPGYVPVHHNPVWGDLMTVVVPVMYGGRFLCWLAADIDAVAIREYVSKQLQNFFRFALLVSGFAGMLVVLLLLKLVKEKT